VFAKVNDVWLSLKDLRRRAEHKGLAERERTVDAAAFDTFFRQLMAEITRKTPLVGIGSLNALEFYGTPAMSQEGKRISWSG